MPIYEYRCPVCGVESERIVIYGEDDVGGCRNPECQYGGPLRRIMSVPAISKLAVPLD